MTPKSITFTKQNGSYQEETVFKAVRAIISLLDNGEYQISIEKHRKKRSLPQNALFHLWVGVIADNCGFSSLEECKLLVKRHILGMRVIDNPISGDVERVDYSTSAMSESDMSAFMDKIKAWAQTDLGIYLPYVGDIGYEELVKQGR
jgi:hypothetical protein